MPILQMEPGTFSFRMNVLVKPSKVEAKVVKIPVDAVIQPKKVKLPHLPILIEAKSAGDLPTSAARKRPQKSISSRLPSGNKWFLCYFSADILTQRISATKRPKT